MELVQELFVTASVALLLSFLVAKLVSLAMAGDVGRELGFKAGKIVDGEVVEEEMTFEERLRVQGLESEGRFEFVGEEDVKKVDEYEGRGSVCVDENPAEISLGGEEFVQSERRVEFVGEEDVKKVDEDEERGSVRVDENSAEISRCGEQFVDECCELPDGKEAEVVESPEKSSERKYGEEESVAEEVGESGLEGVNEDNLEGLVEEVMIGNKEADDEIGVELRTANVDNIVVAQSEEGRVVKCGVMEGRDAEREGLLSGDEDDWEGIERSQLEKDFAAAAKFVGGSGNKDGRLSSVGSDVQMQLFGLQKVAMEGPCHAPQPMALMMSARANWNAWQKLGNMSPEVAMEQYIAVLSDKVPGWMEESSAGDGNLDTPEAGILSPDPDSSMSLDHRSNSTNERQTELKSETEGSNPTGASNSVKRDKE